MKVNFLAKPFNPGEVKYSLFAKKVTFLGTTSGINIESLKERWFEAIITGPEEGTFLNPFTFGLNSKVKTGSRNDFNNPYANLSPCAIDWTFDCIEGWPEESFERFLRNAMALI